MNKRVYGWYYDVHDPRDILYKSIRAPLKKVAEKVDLREYCSPVEDQGSLGSCTAQALVGNIELLSIKKVGAYTDLSRLFVYYNERVLENTVLFDGGATIRSGIKSLVKWGVCEEALWPYNIRKFTARPPKAAYTNSVQKVIKLYARLTSLSDMLTCLNDGFPVVLGITVFNSMETKQVAKTGVVSMPTRKDKPVGGHAVMLVGYDKPAKTFLVRNSWGTSWGKQGYFTIPFEYIQNYSGDVWTIRQ